MSGGAFDRDPVASTRRDDLRTLGLLPTATPEQILHAYLRLRRALRADSPALRTAASEGERVAMLRRVEEAYLRLTRQAAQPIPGTGPRVRAGEPATPTWSPAANPSGSPVPARRPSAWTVERGPVPQPGPGVDAAPHPDAAADPGEPSPDIRSRPSPFRRRPSLPLR